MHGLGNDFVVIDLPSQNAELSALQIRQLADRHRGIGCDQLRLLVEAPNRPRPIFTTVFLMLMAKRLGSA